MIWHCRDHRFLIGPRPLVMGIVNVTPDSFSDGGSFADPAAAIAHGLRLVADGADILDVGGESTRPGSDPVPAAEQLRRIRPVVAALAERAGVSVSVDTSSAEVARRCLAAGAAVVNDVTGLRGDPDMPGVAAEFGAGVVVMHMQGTPKTMHVDPRYADVVREVGEFFEERLRATAAAGIPAEAVCLDPGVGFGKDLDHTLTLLAALPTFTTFGRPICLGVSRKGFLGQLTGRDRAERMPATLAVNVLAAARGGAHVLRVHDVAPTRDAAVLLDAVDRPRR